MNEKLDDFIIGPQADEFAMNNTESDIGSDDDFAKKYDENFRRRCDENFLKRYEERLQELYDENIRNKSEERIEQMHNNRRLPDISNIIDDNSDDFDYGR